MKIGMILPQYYTIDRLAMIQLSQQNLFRARATTGSMISSFFDGGSFSWNTESAYQLSREVFKGEGFMRTVMIRSYIEWVKVNSKREEWSGDH